MILISVDVFDPECRIFLHCTIENLLEFNEYIWLQYLSAIFSTPYNMILMSICGVIKAANPHGISLPRLEA